MTPQTRERVSHFSDARQVKYDERTEKSRLDFVLILS